MELNRWEYAAYLFYKVYISEPYPWGRGKRFSTLMGKTPTRGHKILKDLEKRGYVAKLARGNWTPTSRGIEAYKNIHTVIDSGKKRV